MGALRTEPHRDRKLSAAEAVETKANTRCALSFRSSFGSALIPRVLNAMRFTVMALSVSQFSQSFSDRLTSQHNPYPPFLQVQFH
jgi:hypothetical protein